MLSVERIRAARCMTTAAPSPYSTRVRSCETRSGTDVLRQHCGGLVLPPAVPMTLVTRNLACLRAAIWTCGEHTVAMICASVAGARLHRPLGHWKPRRALLRRSPSNDRAHCRARGGSEGRRPGSQTTNREDVGLDIAGMHPVTGPLKQGPSLVSYRHSDPKHPQGPTACRPAQLLLVGRFGGLDE